jgi:hypothetical protein
MLDAFEPGDTEDRERLCGYLEEIMEIFGIESSDGLLNRWLYGFDPQEQSTQRATRASNVRGVMAYLKDGRIYLFTMAVAANHIHTLDACRAEHAAGVSAEVLGRDVLVLLRMTGRPMSDQEHRRRANPLEVHFGKKIDARFCKGMGLASVAQPADGADTHVGPMQFEARTAFPAGEPAILPNAPDPAELGEAVIAKLFQSQQLNS